MIYKNVNEIKVTSIRVSIIDCKFVSTYSNDF